MDKRLERQRRIALLRIIGISSIIIGSTLVGVFVNFSDVRVLESSEWLTSFGAVASVTTGLVALVAQLISQRFYRARPISLEGGAAPPPRSAEARLAQLTQELNRSMLALAAIRDELQQQAANTEAELVRFKQDIETYKPLAEASREQADAFVRVLRAEVRAELQAEVRAEGRRSFWAQFWMQVALGVFFFLAGVLATVLLGS